MGIKSYCKIWNLGHKAVLDLLKDPVIVEEKIDGSQFSFGIIDGQLFCMSHHQNLDLNSAGMFQPAVDYVKSIQHLLTPNYTYRGEFLGKPKQNCLVYSRIPKNFIILFDVDKGQENYLSGAEKFNEATRLGLECIPLFYGQAINKILDLNYFKELLNTQSCLGGTTIEGIVIKNYYRFDPHTGHCLMGKYVSEKFKEMNQSEFRKNNPTQGDIILQIASELRTDARWLKAIQHLREQGQLEDAPQDIGKLLKEIHTDIEGECADFIKARLYNQARKIILAKVTAGFPQFYKDLLLKKQLGE